MQSQLISVTFFPFPPIVSCRIQTDHQSALLGQSLMRGFYLRHSFHGSIPQFSLYTLVSATLALITSQPSSQVSSVWVVAWV